MTEPTVHQTARLSLFTVSLSPPFRLSFHLCVHALYRRACLLSLWDLPWINVPFGVVSCAKRRELAASSVARVCRLTPLQDF